MQSAPRGGFPRWAVILWSSAAFVAIHFTMLGTLQPAMFNLPFLAILSAVTAVYVLVLVRTGSLRWPTISHVLTDLGNLNVLVFMGLVSL